MFNLEFYQIFVYNNTIFCRKFENSPSPFIVFIISAIYFHIMETSQNRISTNSFTALSFIYISINFIECFKSFLDKPYTIVCYFKARNWIIRLSKFFFRQNRFCRSNNFYTNWGLACVKFIFNTLNGVYNYLLKR